MVSIISMMINTPKREKSPGKLDETGQIRFVENKCFNQV